jgi:hypothetical protein
VITIWKFPLQPASCQIVEIPLPAKILSVQEQRGAFCLWAEVDPDSEKVEVEIGIIATGQELPSPEGSSFLRHINTFQLQDGALVFHAYEVARLPPP